MLLSKNGVYIRLPTVHCQKLERFEDKPPKYRLLRRRVRAQGSETSVTTRKEYCFKEKLGKTGSKPASIFLFN